MLAVGLIAAACGGDKTVVDAADSSLTQDEVVEMVDSETAAAAAAGEELSQEALAGLVGEAPEGTLERVEVEGVLTNWIRAALWYGELEAQGFTVSDAHLQAGEAELAAASASTPDLPAADSPYGEVLIRLSALSTAIPEYLVTVEEVELEWPVQLCSSHILLETEEDALAAIERLEAGEDFATVAMEVSTGPSGPTGGDLGCVDPASFDADFVAGAVEVEPPGISPPVQSQFGWHVISVRSFDATPSDDPVVIQNAVFSTPEFADLQTAAFEQPVTIDPVYGDWDAATATVVASGG